MVKFSIQDSSSDDEEVVPIRSPAVVRPPAVTPLRQANPDQIDDFITSPLSTDLQRRQLRDPTPFSPEVVPLPQQLGLNASKLHMMSSALYGQDDEDDESVNKQSFAFSRSVTSTQFQQQQQNQYGVSTERFVDEEVVEDEDMLYDQEDEGESGVPSMDDIENFEASRVLRPPTASTAFSYFSPSPQPSIVLIAGTTGSVALPSLRASTCVQALYPSLSSSYSSVSSSSISTTALLTVSSSTALVPSVDPAFLSAVSTLTRDTLVESRRSFRVGWGPGGVLVHTVSPPSSHLSVGSPQGTAIVIKYLDISPCHHQHQLSTATSTSTSIAPKGSSSTLHLSSPSASLPASSSFPAITLDELALHKSRVIALLEAHAGLTDGVQHPKLSSASDGNVFMSNGEGGDDIALVEEQKRNMENVMEEEDQRSKANFAQFCQEYGAVLADLLPAAQASSALQERAAVKHAASVWDLVARLFSPQSGPSRESLAAQGVSAQTAENHARLQGLSCWLEQAIQEEIQDELDEHLAAHSIAGAGNASGNTQIIVKSVFSLLSGNQIERACATSLEARDFHLTTLLAQAGESLSSARLVRQQISEWRKSGVWDRIDEQHKRIYRLLAADTQGVSQGLSWLRALALRMWFGGYSPALAHSPQQQQQQAVQQKCLSVAQCVGMYEADVMDPVNPVAAPLACYAYSRTGTTLAKRSPSSASSSLSSSSLQLKYTDVRFGLLKLFCSRTFKLSSIVCPQAFVQSHLDVSLSWHLADALARVAHLPALNRTPELVMNFIFQLDTLGLWYWAVYVAMYSVPIAPTPISAASSDQAASQWGAHVHREQIVKEILFRSMKKQVQPTPSAQSNADGRFMAGREDRWNLQQEVDQSEKQAQLETFLLQIARIPQEWLEEALGRRALYDRQYEIALRHFQNACMWQEVHDILLRELAASLMLSRRFAELEQFIDRLTVHQEEIANWNRGGQLFAAYFQLQRQTRQALTEFELGTSDGALLEALDPLLQELLVTIAAVWTPTSFQGTASPSSTATTACLLLSPRPTTANDRLMMRVVAAQVSSIISNLLLELHRVLHKSSQAAASCSALYRTAALTENIRLCNLQRSASDYLRFGTTSST